jgi:TRAP-type C4-dicarboxylate transport system substrate-binding protein
MAGKTAVAEKPVSTLMLAARVCSNIVGMANRCVSPALLVTLAIVILAGCNADPVDKSGAGPDSPTTLTMLLPEAGDPEGQFFVDAVARRSNGRLHIVVDSATYNSADPAREARAVGAVRDGKADLGFVAARNLAAAGDGGFQALMAPFAVTTLDATLALSQSPVATTLLQGLGPLGLVGLGLIPGEPRQILSTRPLFGPTLGGAGIRVVDNVQTVALIKAMSGVPVEKLTAHAVGVALRAGTLIGAETSPTYILANSYNTVARYLTAYGLMPRLDTIVASAASWQKLDPASRNAIKQAVVDTRDKASQDLPGREAKELATLCTSGVVIDQLASSDLQAMAGATRAVLPTGRNAQKALQLIRKSLKGFGPQVLAVAPPAGCVIAHTVAEAAKAPRPGGQELFVHKGGAVIPPGTYVTTDTVADFHAEGIYGRDFDKDVTYTQTFRADGSFLATQVPDYPDQGPVAGRYEVTGDTVLFTLDAATGIAPETVKWSYFDGQLTFTVVQVQDSGSRVIYLAHPWRRVR